MKKWLCVLLVFAMVLGTIMVMPISVSAAKLTHLGNLRYGGSRYQLVLNDKGYNFAQMKKYCESKGGHLATITSAGENEALYDFMLSLGYESAYFGFTDEKKEGIWKWVTGEPAKYTNWSSGEPNNGCYENYGMFYYDSQKYCWNDGGADTWDSIYKTPFICEWDIRVLSQTATSVTIKWEETEVAEEYQVQQYSLGEWKTIKTAYSDSYTVKNLDSGSVFKFRIKTYSSDGSCLSTTRAITAVTTPQATTVKKLYSNSRRITLRWKNITCNGYQIEYSKNKDFIGSKRTNVLNPKATSKTIYNVSKGQKYYVRIRAYVKNSGKKYYGKWSKIKSVRVK